MTDASKLPDLISIGAITGNANTDNVQVANLLKALGRAENDIRSLPSEVAPQNLSIRSSPPQGVSPGKAKFIFTIEILVAVDPLKAVVG